MKHIHIRISIICYYFDFYTTINMADVREYNDENGAHQDQEVIEIPYGDVNHMPIYVRYDGIPMLYISPLHYSRLFDMFVQYQPFLNACARSNVYQHLMNHNIMMDNEEYSHELYCRYLCCTGRVNDLFAHLNLVRNMYGIRLRNGVNRNNMNEDFDANAHNNELENMCHRFMNRVDVPGFENNTLLDMFMMYNNDCDSVVRLHYMGAQTHFRSYNYHNFIHNCAWENPFAQLLNGIGFPVLHAEQLRNHELLHHQLQNYEEDHENPLHVIRHRIYFEESQRALVILGM